jgi:hypothetical protein
MDNLKDIFPIAEKKTDFKNLNPEQLKALGPEKLSKMSIDDLKSLNDEQRLAIFDILPPEYQELITEDTPVSNRVSVEVKGIKNDMPHYVPIEIETIPDSRGIVHPGWIFGKANLVAFAIGDTPTSENIAYFLMVERTQLAGKIKSFIDAGKLKETTNKQQAKASLDAGELIVYKRVSEGQVRGKVVYIPISELMKFKRGNGVLKIKK